MTVFDSRPAPEGGDDLLGRLLIGQHQVLERIARGDQIEEVLAAFCDILERNMAGSRSCVMTLNVNDQTLQVSAAPHLPEPFRQALNGITVGLAPGSCSAAAYRNETIVSSNIARDPVWEGMSDEALAHGLASCWSAPIRFVRWAEGPRDHDEIRVLGTLALYFEEAATPSPAQLRALETAAALASLALSTTRTKAKSGSEQPFDPVTELPNRRVFTQQLKQIMRDVDSREDKLAILLLDLDHFQEVNDTFGYSVGDFLLRSVAERLIKFRRSTDLLARFGDDEFIFLINGTATGEEVKDFATQVLEAVGEPYDFGGQHLAISASLGGSIYPWDGEDGQTLMRNAENALFAAKKQGRNHFRLYAPTMGGYAFEKLQLKMALGYAVENRELEVLYQPKVSAETHEIVGAEALVYWNHPGLGRLGPVKFIPLAEETGLIIPIGEYVMRTACRQAEQWRRTGAPNLTMAVNISAIQFRESSFPVTVGSILKETRLASGALELELTETVAMNEVKKTLERLEALKNLGLNIAIDDFGTGYSSLAYLKRFPIHTLKIDKSFVLKTPGDKEDVAIVKAVIALAHLLGMGVVAEGVETAEQAAYLRTEGCEILQGFYFSTPVSAGAFGDLLRTGFELRSRTA